MQHTQHHTTPRHTPISRGATWLALLLCLVLPLQPVLAGEITYYYPDATGSPVAATDAQGNILWREHYQPYGEKLNEPCPAPCNTPADYEDVGYTGHEYDAETGLTYMQARYYDPEVGRFLAIDPVGFKPGQPMTFNRYSYANNNPYKYIDPNGEAAVLGPGWAVAVAEPSPVGEVVMVVVTVGVLGALLADAIMNESAEDKKDLPTGDDIKINDKIEGQLGERGWTEEEVRDLTETEPAGESTDNTNGQNESATVYGSKDKGHVVVNDNTGNVTQVSDKKDPDWVPDSRIKWKEDQ